MLIVNPRIQIPMDEFEFTYVRSSGPGGQNVNKVNSKAVMRWPFTLSPSVPDDVRQRFQTKFGKRLTSEGELLVTSQRFRDQEKNTADCLDKLREMLLSVAAKPIPRRPTKPTRASKKRTRESKQAHSQKKQQRRSVGDHE